VPVPADFAFDRTVRSHGWFDLPPFRYDRAARLLSFGFVARAGATISVEVRALGGDGGGVTVTSSAARAEAAAVVRSVLRLDENLASARAVLAGAPALLGCVEAGGGRILRAPSAFEDTAKMLCTINCSWSLTRLMVTRMVEAAGPAAPDGTRAFPTAPLLARRPLRFFKDVVRAGYRAPYLKELAERVTDGELDLEGLRDPSMPGEAAYERLRSIKGIGPYAADNLMRLLGHHDRLGLDSWCRARYLKLYPNTRRAGVDAAIARRYRAFAPYRGLAMWLDLTRHWHEPDTTWP
jgi:N-glycosylase/DNA lyase